MTRDFCMIYTTIGSQLVYQRAQPKINFVCLSHCRYTVINSNVFSPGHFFALDVPDRFCNSPLHWATKEDNQPILLALIKGGANVNAKGHIGRTPLHIAVCINYSNLFTLKQITVNVELVSTIKCLSVRHLT